LEISSKLSGHFKWLSFSQEILKLVEALDGMNRKFANPYIIFYPTVSRDGIPFPVNKCIRAIQGTAFQEQVAWRGNIVVAKYRDSPFSSMIDASMADFPILKNYLLTHGSPPLVSHQCITLGTCSNMPKILRSHDGWFCYLKNC
jgi:hypothetical protein